MKMNFKTNMIVRLWAVFLISLLATSCSNDAFFGFEDETTIFPENYIFDLQIDYSSSNYLTIDSTKNTYSNDDYEIIASALNRLVANNYGGIVHIKNCDYRSLNISTYLYDICINMIYHNNDIVKNSKMPKKYKRTKSRSPEFERVSGDCVPVALTHVLVGTAPNLQQAYSYCDIYDPTWRSTGVHKSNLVSLLNNEIHSVYRCDGGFLYNSNSIIDLQNCLLLFKGNVADNIPGHAVNACTFVSNLPDSSDGWIFYCDYWSGGVLGAVLSSDSSSINSILIWN